MESIEVRILRELEDRKRYGQMCNEIKVHSDLWQEMRLVMRENALDKVWSSDGPPCWTFMGMKVIIDDSLPSTCFRIQ
jgi:hypothetical protein